MIDEAPGIETMTHDEDAQYRDASGRIDPFKFALKKQKPAPYTPPKSGEPSTCSEAENDCEQDEGA